MKATQYTYKDYVFYILFQDSFSYVAICNGHEVCFGSSITKTRVKFETLVDSGMVVKEKRVIQ